MSKKNAPVEVQLDGGQTINHPEAIGEGPMLNIISPPADIHQRALVAMHRPGWTVAAQLDAHLDRLMRGEVQLWELHPALAAWFIAGFDAGRASLASDIERARDEAARWYEIAHNPGRELSDVQQRRIDEALEAAWDARELHTELDVVRVACGAAESPRRAA